VEYDAGIAECLYVALVTDTGSFKFDLTTPEVHQLAARLVANRHQRRRDLAAHL
jgi:phosphoesterase RecJ-like protein